jgi:hypothetical protein
MIENIVLNAFAFLENGTLTNGNANSPTPGPRKSFFGLDRARLGETIGSDDPFLGLRVPDFYSYMSSLFIVISSILFIFSRPKKTQASFR